MKKLFFCTIIGLRKASCPLSACDPPSLNLFRQPINYDIEKNGWA